MWRVSQLPLFSVAADPVGSARGLCRPDPESEHLLAAFQVARLAQGASPQSVRREMSQLRAVMREAGVEGQPAALWGLFADLGLVARVLCEPRMQIARSTGRARLVAVQRFIQIVGSTLGRDPDADLATLEALLPNLSHATPAERYQVQARLNAFLER